MFFIKQLLALAVASRLPLVSFSFVISSSPRDGVWKSEKYLLLPTLNSQKKGIAHSLALAAAHDDIIPPDDSFIDDNGSSSNNNNNDNDNTVVLNRIVHSLDTILYPTQELEQRNAASRTDGYWKYIQRGEEPPLHFTYGEFDIVFLKQVLERIFNKLQQFDHKDQEQQLIFTDIGSGTGRLVFGAAALPYNWTKCRGIELLPSIHVVAEERLEWCRSNGKKKNDGNDESKAMSRSMLSDDEWLQQFDGQFMLNDDITNSQDDDDNEMEENPSMAQSDGEQVESIASSATLSDIPQKEGNDPSEEESSILYLPFNDENDDTDPPIPLSPIEFKCGPFQDIYFGDSNIVFCFSSCMSATIRSQLAKAIGQQCRPGTIIITTDYSLPLKGIAIDPRDDHDELQWSHCDNYDGDFDAVGDEEAWIEFCQEEGLQEVYYELELLESIDGHVGITGGISTCHVHRVVQSAWRQENNNHHGDDNDAQKNIEERAAMAWMYGLKNNQQDEFYRQVRNNFIYHGFSESWYKDIPPLDDNNGNGGKTVW